MEIKTQKSFNNLISSLTEEILDEEDLDEITGTAGSPGFMIPMAFDKDKKKKKKVDEALESKDLETIKKLVRSVISDVLRDIWIKRASWK